MKIAVIIPCYKTSKKTVEVVAGIPDLVDTIVLIEDCSPDDTPEIVKKLESENEKIKAIYHSKNSGVGGAMISGFKYAVENDIDIVVKMDGDGQMDPAYILDLLNPLKNGNADFAKGNRFYDLKTLKKMPVVRRLGNLILSFAIKAASGYWNIFDPANGYFAVRTDVLKQINFDRLAKDYFFESSLLIELNLVSARIADIPIPARYDNEVSNLSVSRVAFTFPFKITHKFIRRILHAYFLYDFNIGTVYILFGSVFTLFGLIFGGTNWHYYSNLGTEAPTGTVIIAALTLILGVQFLMQALNFDIEQNRNRAVTIDGRKSIKG